MPMRTNCQRSWAWVKRPPLPLCSAAQIVASRPRLIWKPCLVGQGPDRALRPGCCLTCLRRTGEIRRSHRPRGVKCVPSKIFSGGNYANRKALMTTANPSRLASPVRFRPGQCRASRVGRRTYGGLLPYQSPPRHLLYMPPGDEVRMISRVSSFWMPIRLSFRQAHSPDWRPAIARS